MENQKDQEVIDIKCIVIGDSGVGKSCIIQRYITNTFNSQSLSTLGAMYFTKTIENKDKKYNINIWDTAGQEIYQNITSLYYRDTQVAIVVFSCLNNESKNNVFNWINQILSKNKEEIVIYIICNKIDLKINFKLNPEFLDKIKNKNYKIFYTSAKENKGIYEVFDGIIDDIINIGIENDNNIKKRNTIHIEEKKIKPQSKCCN